MGDDYNFITAFFSEEGPARSNAATRSGGGAGDVLRRRLDRLERKIARRSPATGRFWDRSSIEP
jgi:hypothetical protein